MTLEGWEYQRYESGVTYPLFTPIRFPGQYFDPETDFVENWNRYYDPMTGRYLQPEPMLQKPSGSLTAAIQGRSLPAYAYANNNPLHFTDPDGNTPCNKTYSCCIQNAVAAGQDPKEKCNASGTCQRE